MMASEGMLKAFVLRFKLEFGTVKIGLDVMLVILSVVVSMLMFSTVYGVREGTIIAAVLVGGCIKLVKMPVYALVERFIR